MINTDLYNALRTLRPDLPDVQNGREAWEAVKPDKPGPYLKQSFWWTLGRTLPFARSNAKQKKIADWIYRFKAKTKVTGQQWPPNALKLF